MQAWLKFLEAEVVVWLSMVGQMLFIRVEDVVVGTLYFILALLLVFDKLDLQLL